MTIYAEFDDEFRPGPRLWRLAMVGACQLILAVWIVQALISVADMGVLRKARAETIWIVDAVPWQTLKGDLANRLGGDVSDFAIRSDRAYDELNELAAGVFILVAILVLFFVPGSRTLANRLFMITFAQTAAVFGGAFALRRCLSAVCRSPRELVLLLAGLAAVSIVVIGESKANAILANVFTMTPGRRLASWACRTLIGCCVIGAACWYVGNVVGAQCAATLAALTLVANMLRRPKAAGERIDDVALVEASAALPAIAGALLAISLWAFGYGDRGVVVTSSSVRRLAWNDIRRDLASIHDDAAPTRPKIEIHWSRRPSKIRRKGH